MSNFQRLVLITFESNSSLQTRFHSALEIKGDDIIRTTAAHLHAVRLINDKGSRSILLQKAFGWPFVTEEASCRAYQWRSTTLPENLAYLGKNKNSCRWWSNS